MSAKNTPSPDALDPVIVTENSQGTVDDHRHEPKGHKSHNQSQLPGHHTAPTSQRPNSKSPGKGH